MVSEVWREFMPLGSREPVRARQVQLWGQLVFVNETGEVWCPCCRAFLSTEVLGRPYNGHPSGLQVPEGTIVVTAEGDDGPVPRSLLRDLLGRPW